MKILPLLGSYSAPTECKVHAILKKIMYIFNVNIMYSVQMYCGGLSLVICYFYVQRLRDTWPLCSKGQSCQDIGISLLMYIVHMYLGCSHVLDYSKTWCLRPPVLPKKCGLKSQVVLKYRLILNYKTIFGAEVSGLKSEGGLLAEWSLNTCFIV